MVFGLVRTWAQNNDNIELLSHSLSLFLRLVDSIRLLLFLRFFFSAVRFQKFRFDFWIELFFIFLKTLERSILSPEENKL